MNARTGILALLLTALPLNAQEKDGWKPLFDGKSLAGWKSTNFGGEGPVKIIDTLIVLEMGEPMTGITSTRKDLPKMNYELAFEAKKMAGSDFFCTTTFPVGDTHCSLVVGGWGGGVVGLSSLNGNDASENETSTFKDFKKDQWYKVRIRVTPDRIEAWIDDKSMVDVNTKGQKISIRAECDESRPLGISTYRTAGAIRDIRLRTLPAGSEKK